MTFRHCAETGEQVLTLLVPSEMSRNKGNILWNMSQNDSVFDALLTFCAGSSPSSAPSLAPVASMFIDGNVGSAASCSTKEV